MPERTADVRRRSLPRALARLLELPAGRRGKLVVVALWVAVAMAAGPLAGQLEQAQDNSPTAFLPGDAESVRALELERRLGLGDELAAVTVLRRDGGLTGADREHVARVRAALDGDRPPGAGATGEAVVSDDGTTAMLVTPVARDGGDGQAAIDVTEAIRERVAAGPEGLSASVTGPAGYLTDSVAVFDGIDGRLLLAAASLVLVLLVVIYRSPIFWAIPFVAVLLAEIGSRAAGYLAAEAGVTVNGMAAGVLPVLVFGAGTDYALLLVARYREELRRHSDRHDAMRAALAQAGPTILASGTTTALALMACTLAAVDGTRGLGAICALGIAVAVTTMLTLLPALLLLGGRRAFWPFVPRYGSAGAGAVRGPWRSVGERIARRPRRAALAGAATLAVLATGLVSLSTDLTSGADFRGEVEAVEGQRALERAFPAGANAPTTAIVTDPARAGAVRAAIERAPGVAEVAEPKLRGGAARIDVTLAEPPFDIAAIDRIPSLRAAAHAAAPGAVAIGGPTAEEHDLRAAAARDNRAIIPVALVAVLAVLVILLRAIVAPLVAIATVVASYAAALGLGAFAFDVLLGYPGVAPTLPLLAFVFAVALGVDYNVFLMARVREEAARHGTREGLLRGLAATGGVITSAGVVLAGTFATLAVLPLISMTELGLVIAAGVLLDALLVRTVLLPALVLLLGDRSWRPARRARDDDNRPRQPRGSEQEVHA